MAVRAAPIVPPTVAPTPEPQREPQAAEVDLGARIRTLRLAQGATLRQLAAQAGVTESFLSQVERGVASPSIASVQRIARALGQSIAELFTADDPAGTVVRAGDRRKVVYQGLGAVDEFLTRGTDGRLQLILSTIEPGGGTGDEAYTHDSDEEVVVVLEGSLDLWVGAEHYRLEAGDAVTHPSRVPHRNTNPGPGVARALFCITPPSY
ncbi:MAG TPA: cupin domain-containing protein [Candidatus Limnocylindria bacterium]|nr:cupin domain-containing protein [Candidatus Limnocylindria bacterium]